jgi:hypothetical protein
LELLSFRSWKYNKKGTRIEVEVFDAKIPFADRTSAQISKAWPTISSFKGE